ncbi:hypothetical protein AVEN_80846-1 [Araneus ventricosus]|uniref:Uncharacterized protein n=1 Tax=Araneus ventricosus TaxID=182803 RepID=A0A4Y2Q1K0_ARAVE|nr:hypothetical protein AVEN_80846-1 [Araneus ventricosus]
MVQSGLIRKNLKKSKLNLIETNFRPRCEDSDKTKDLPTLAPRVETRYETRNPPHGGRVWEATLIHVSKQTSEQPCMLCLIVRQKWVEKTSLMTNGLASLFVNAQL